ERFDHLSRIRLHPLDRQSAPLDHFGEGRALHKLHRDRLNFARLDESVNRRDTGMIQRRKNLRFALKAAQAVGIARENWGQNLESDLPFQVHVASAIPLAHAACSSEHHHLVMRDSSTCRERHWMIILLRCLQYLGSGTLENRRVAAQGELEWIPI